MTELRYDGKTIEEWIDAIRTGKATSPDAMRAFREGRVGPAAKPAVPFLIETLDDHTAGLPYNVRYVAAFALGRIGVSAAAAIPALKKQALEDSDSTAVVCAAEALVRIGAKKCGTSFWRDLLTHEYFYVARVAAQALRRIGPDAADATESLFDALSSHKDLSLPQIYCDAAAALVKIAPNDPRLVGELTRGIGMSNYGFQKTAIEGLVEIGSEEALDVLRHVYDHMHTAPMSPSLEKLLQKVVLKVPGLEIQPPTTASCPKCGAVLRTTKAQQCFECGADWHSDSRS